MAANYSAQYAYQLPPPSYSSGSGYGSYQVPGYGTLPSAQGYYQEMNAKAYGASQYHIAPPPQQLYHPADQAYAAQHPEAYNNYLKTLPSQQPYYSAPPSPSHHVQAAAPPPPQPQQAYGPIVNAANGISPDRYHYGSAPGGPTFGAVAKNEQAEAWSQYMGEPRSLWRRDETEGYPIELSTIEKAYRGKSRFFEIIMITMLFEQELIPIRLLMPMTQHYGGFVITWDKWEFDDHVLTKVPTLAVSRLISNRMSSGRTQLFRQGIAMEMEWDFYKTERGKTQWRMNILQIVNAINVTSCMGVIVALLNTANYNVHVDKRYRFVIRSIEDGQRYIDWKIKNMYAFNKEPRAMRRLLDDLKVWMNDRCGRDGNYVQTPMGTGRFVKAAGLGGLLYQKGDKIPGLGTSNMIITESTKYPQGPGIRPHDPLVAVKQDCYFAVMDREFSAAKAEKEGGRTTTDMNIRLLSEHTGNYETIQYREVINKSALFIEKKKKRPHRFDPGDPTGGGGSSYEFGLGRSAAGPSLTFEEELEEDSGNAGEYGQLTSDIGRRFFGGNMTWGEYMQSKDILNEWVEFLCKRPELYKNLTARIGSTDKDAILRAMPELPPGVRQERPFYSSSSASTSGPEKVLKEWQEFVKHVKSSGLEANTNRGVGQHLWYYIIKALVEKPADLQRLLEKANMEFHGDDLSNEADFFNAMNILSNGAHNIIFPEDAIEDKHKWYAPNATIYGFERNKRLVVDIDSTDGVRIRTAVETDIKDPNSVLTRYSYEDLWGFGSILPVTRDKILTIRDLAVPDWIVYHEIAKYSNKPSYQPSEWKVPFGANLLLMPLWFQVLMDTLSSKWPIPLSSSLEATVNTTTFNVDSLRKPSSSSSVGYMETLKDKAAELSPPVVYSSPQVPQEILALDNRSILARLDAYVKKYLEESKTNTGGAAAAKEYRYVRPPVAPGTSRREGVDERAEFGRIVTGLTIAEPKYGYLGDLRAVYNARVGSTSDLRANGASGWVLSENELRQIFQLLDLIHDDLSANTSQFSWLLVKYLMFTALATLYEDRNGFAKKILTTIKHHGNRLSAAEPEVLNEIFNVYTKERSARESMIRDLVTARAASSRRGAGGDSSDDDGDDGEYKEEPSLEDVQNKSSINFAGMDSADQRNIVEQFLFNLPITKHLVDWGLDNNAPPILNFLLIRQFLMEVGHMLYMIRNGFVGLTFAREPNCFMAVNTKQQTIQVDVTIWMRSCVLQALGCIVLDSVVAFQCLGGGHVNIYDNADKVAIADHRAGRPSADIIVCPLHPNEHPTKRNWIDLTGVTHPMLYSATGYSREGRTTEKNNYHYAMAPVMAQLWGWEHDENRMPLEMDGYRLGMDSRIATLVYRDHAMVWGGPRIGVSNDLSLDRAITSAGPWEEFYYPGCKKDRYGGDPDIMQRTVLALRGGARAS